MDILDEFAAAWKAATSEMAHELADASYVAASVGVVAEKAEHPYTDRTGDLTGTAEPADNTYRGERGAVMVWPMKYASYVTKVSGGKFGFTPIAISTAETALEGLANRAAENIAAKLSG